MNATPLTAVAPARAGNGAPHLEIDATRAKLVALGLGHAAEALAEELAEAISTTGRHTPSWSGCWPARSMPATSGASRRR